MKVLVTGGAGYIGSHTVVALIEAGMEPVVVDNFSNSSPKALERVEEIAGCAISSYEADIRDDEALTTIFHNHRIDAVIHFAGLKAVGESVEHPLRYYRTNLDSTLTLLETMGSYGVKRLVFSSSATVYGPQEQLPYVESMPRRATNPYGWSKVMIEQMLDDLVASDDEWAVTSLRYFNPVGAHPSGLIGEDPDGIPNNLMPYITQVAVGRREYLGIFGDDYPTDDGTGVRDYIHVCDLAEAHVAALRGIEHPGDYRAYNIGTGTGVSVLEVVKAFEKASGQRIPCRIMARRPGDLAAYWGDPALAERELGWRARLTIEDACRDSWAWQQKNPHGLQ
ncbi:UDP-glucose 4-epimerase GalE [Arcanobacterium haemolyticum]|nr:UDP-glucose 4-epimerase GalE [Arcanobacterium haemolyticum]